MTTLLTRFLKTTNKSCHWTPSNKLRTQDFAGPLSSRASRFPGPISRHRIADILPHMKRVSRASRPGLLVGFLCILCDELCNARRFHTAENDHTCRVGCPVTLSLLQCVSQTVEHLFFWGHATKVPQRCFLSHDVISLVFLCGIQYGVVVLGFFDTFIHAHHHHSFESAKAGSFGDRKDSIHDGHHSCQRPREPNNLSCDAHSWRPTPLFPSSQTQAGHRFSPMIPLPTNLAVGAQCKWWYSRCGGV